jgi:HSP20 family protein
MPHRNLAPWAPSRGLTPLGRDPFTSFRRQMDRLFDDFFAPFESTAGEGAALAPIGRWPSLDVDETDQAYKVTAELPGLEQKDVEVNLRDNVLTISGEKREERNEGEGGRHYTERTFGRFERAIPFNVEIDADKVQAKFKNGVLTIELPKNPKAREKMHRIEVKTH